jgi:MOSC domain-containing protein YiiM
MIIESIAVGGPQTVLWRGEEVVTSIFKSPVTEPVMVRRHNLDGDRQSDSGVHGGEYKAIYAYAAEHYDWWRTQLGRELEPANFGENLTIRDFDEPSICIGDVFRAGESELEAAAPRLPCYKLGIRFGDAGMVKRFTNAGRWGIYFRVAREGRISVGDKIELIAADAARLPVYEIARIYVSDRGDRVGARRLAEHDRLDPSWRSFFYKLSEFGDG